MDATESAVQQNASWPAGACTLDHEGCVVCSDAGIPLRVVALEGDDALCEDAAGNQTLIAVELVLPVNVGDIVLTHGGVAIGRGDRTVTREGDDEVRQ
ncbi:MAG TPA: HypC/HybG/HupF family hydrogenase formation chaperone [Chloroflexota bacterium]